MAGWISRQNRSLFLFTLACFALRLILLVQYAGNNPFYVHPIVDSAFYLNWADAINSGKVFFEHEYHHPPGYAFFLALILKTTGENLFAILFLQCLMMVVLGLLIFFTADRILNRTSAWVSYVLFTLCGPMTFYSMKILSEPLYTLLLFSSFFCIWRYTNNLRLSGLFAGAVFLGMATEVRGNAIVCVIPAVAAIFSARQRIGGTPAGAKHFAIFALGIALVVAPVLLRNGIRGRAWTPVAANWGENFYYGNNPRATGSFSSAPGFDTTLEGQIRSVQKEANRLSGRDLTSLEAQSFWFNKSLEYIRTDPLGWLKIEGRKILKMFDRKEASSIYYYDLESENFQPFIKSLFVTYGWIVPLFLFGFLCLPNLSSFRLLLGYVTAQALLLLVFWPELRFLLPLFPFLFVIAGGIPFASRQILQRKGRLMIAGLGMLLWLCANFLWTQPIQGREAWYANASSAYYAAGRNSEAVRMGREALKLNPNYADAWVNLGAALYSESRLQEAKNAWLNALRIKPDHLMALRNLALSLEKENPDEALRLWRRALDAARGQSTSPETTLAIEQQIERLQISDP